MTFKMAVSILPEKYRGIYYCEFLEFKHAFFHINISFIRQDEDNWLASQISEARYWTALVRDPNYWDQIYKLLT